MGTDFFDGIVKTFSKTTKELGKTTKELGARAEQTIETQKIRGKISGEERTIEKLKADLGDIIYKRHAEGEGIDGELSVICQEIDQHFLKIRDRELERLRCSFEAAKAAGYEKFIMFLHYPPTSIGEMESPFTLMAQEYGAEKVIYSHCHGEKRYDDSFKGYVDGIEYKLVSGDYMNFKPELVLR